MPWFEIQLRVPESLRDPVASRLFDWGAAGVDESEPNPQGIIKAFFQAAERAKVTKELPSFLESLAKVFPEAPKITYTVRDVVEENWSERYKEFFRAQRLSDDFFLLPAWEPASLVPAGMQAIIMEPGQAFGTGLHQSTKLSIRLLERAIQLNPPADKIRLLDLGTGTGILAIVAAKLGVKQITAIDIDTIAVAVAKENFERNQVKGVKLGKDPVTKLKGPFDIIVSNILLEAHLEMELDYHRLLPVGGHLILSGLLTPQAIQLDPRYQRSGFVFECSSSLQDWMALGYAKGAPER